MQSPYKTVLKTLQVLNNEITTFALIGADIGKYCFYSKGLF